ncbi:hypothetical protein A6R74_15005 [Halomonas sp. ALS9]|nr:hypothetical protein A6R74_15005 [Halomonas sp. ALS9]
MTCVFGALSFTANASSFGPPNAWASGWGQGVNEYVANNQYGDYLYIACDPYSHVKMTLNIGEHSYGSYDEKDFSLIIDGQEIQTPYETASRVGANNFYYLWDKLRTAETIVAKTSDGIHLELPTKGAAEELPESDSGCVTEF